MWGVAVIAAIIAGLNEAWKYGEKDFDNPISVGIRLGVRCAANRIGSRLEAQDDKRAVILWLEEHRS